MEPSYFDNSAKSPRFPWIVLALFLFSLAAALGLGGYYLYNYTFRQAGTVKFSFSSQIPGVSLEESKNAGAWVEKSLELLGYDKLVEFVVFGIDLLPAAILIGNNFFRNPRDARHPFI